MITTILAVISGGFRRAWDFASRYPFQALSIILAACLIWQVMAKNAAIDAYEKEKASHAKDIAEWQRKSDAAKAATEKAENDAKEAANNAQDVHDQLVAENDSLERYISAHRLPAQCPGSVSGASKTNRPTVPATAPAETIVAVNAADLRVCDALYSYSQASYAWGRELVSKGLAVDGPVN